MTKTNPQEDQSSENPVLLRVDQLNKSYGTGSKKAEIIGDLTFDVMQNEVVCIVGPSGVGKTTLLKCLAGLQPSTGGEMALEGKKIKGPPKEMALVFQDYSRSLMPWLTVEKNIRLPLRHMKLPRHEVARRVTDSLKAVGLLHAKKQYPWQLSGGMQQRVAIARGLAYRPDILIMDEPFASVDAQTRFELEDLCLKLRDDYGMTILLVTHDIDEAVYLSDRIVVIGQRPAVVLEVVDVDLPSPRDQLESRSHQRFGELRHHVLQQIQEASASSAKTLAAEGADQ